MNCKTVCSLIPEYLRGTLERGEMLQIQSHATHCSSCYEELESLNGMWEKMADWSEQEPSPMLKSRFYTMLESFQHGMVAADTDPKGSKGPWAAFNHWLGRFWPQQPVTQMAMTLAAVVLVLSLSLWRPMGNSETELREAKQDLTKMTSLVSLSLMENQSPSERLNGVGWSVRMDRPEPRVLQALLAILNSDPNVNVRLAAVEALVAYRNIEDVRAGLVGSLAGQKSPMVQIALIDALVAIKPEGAISKIESLLTVETLNPAVKEHAQTRLNQIH